MAVDTLEAKAHELLGRLKSGKLAAVVQEAVKIRFGIFRIRQKLPPSTFWDPTTSGGRR